MPPGSQTGRLAACASWLAAAALLTGCGPGMIKFTNVSDTWLNVSYYVGVDELPRQEQDNPLYLRRVAQVKPGSSAVHWLPLKLVHLHVETVGPTWQPTGQEYWLELLTRPPIHVVASGRGDKLDFKSFQGEVAIIPERERTTRYTHHQSSQPLPGEINPQVVTQAATSAEPGQE